MSHHQSLSLQIYEASSTFTWTIITPNPRILSTSELFNFESSCANFFEVEIESSTAFSEVQVLAVDFDVIDQYVVKDDLQYSLSAYLTITYRGGFIDESNILSAVPTNEKLNELILIENKLFHDSSLSVYGSFSPIKSSSFGSTDDGATDNVVLAIILIAISCMLAITSAALLYQSEYCRCRQKEEEESYHGIKPTLTQETGGELSDSDHSSTGGNLGAHKQADDGDNSIVAITPQRGIDFGYETETPFSQRTVQTNVSNASSVTSRDPLGIVAMNTLNKLLHTPQARDTHAKALYNVALSDDDSTSSLS